MHPLWKILNITSQFQYKNEIWTLIHNGDDDDTIVARNEKTQFIKPFNLYCLVEPVGVDMGAGQ